MLSEIGSNFWISPNDGKGGGQLGLPTQFGCYGNDYVWMSTGRSSIKLILQTIENRNQNIEKIALIPSYTCNTVIEPFLEFGYNVYALPITKSLETTTSQIQHMVAITGAKVLLFHRYFGFDTISDLDNSIKILRKKGVITIEDCTQSLYSDFSKSKADYFVASIRKWCGVPDGAFAICRDGVFDNKPFEQDTRLQEAKRAASELKYDYLFKNIGEKSLFLARYREAEIILDSQSKYYTISDLSANIQANLDVVYLKKSRRNNYIILKDGIEGITGIKAAMEDFPSNVVPLYFPVLVDNRDYIQDILADKNIFAPIIWPMSDSCPEVDGNSHYLYEHLLCIPIDQRYDTDDMQRVVKILRNE